MNPEQQQQIAASTVDVFLKIEEQLLVNIAKRLKKNGSLLTEDNISSWQTEQLAMLGSLTQENIISIAKYSGMAIDEVSKALKTAGYEAVSEQETDLQEAVALGLLVAPPRIEASQALQNVIGAYQAQVLDTFNLVGTTMLNQSQQVYLDIVNNVTGVVLSGSMTPLVALRTMASKWANKGIPVLIDKADRHWSTEAYLNMIMRSTINNVANKMQDTRMDEYGVDLIEVSSHMGARPKCAPYQGRIFSRSGKHTKYPALSTTSFGEKDGLRGINCRHTFYPYIESVTRRTYKPYNAKENNEQYKLTQQQRSLERAIRKAKKELAMMQAMGDETGIKEARNKVREHQKAMRDFIEQSGLTRNREREQIV